MINLRLSLLDLIAISGAFALCWFFLPLSGAEIQALMPSTATLWFLGKTLFVGAVLFVLTLITVWGEK